VRAALDHAGTSLKSELWEPYAGRLDLVDVPFLHSQLSGPAASEAIAPQIDARMQAVEGKAS
jgi:enterobactin synthetase component F